MGKIFLYFSTFFFNIFAASAFAFASCISWGFLFLLLGLFLLIGFHDRVGPGFGFCWIGLTDDGYDALRIHMI